MSAPAEFKLPTFLDITCAAALRRQLMELRGTPLALDASAVERVGGLGLQVLMSARATWAADREPLTIAAASPAFQEAVALNGLQYLACSETTGP